MGAEFLYLFRLLREREREFSGSARDPSRAWTGGRFLIDLFNRDFVVANLVAQEHQQRQGYDVEIERWYDDRTQRVNKRIRVHSPNRKAQTFVESVRAYTRREVEESLEQAGLSVDELFGDFQGGPFRSDSERLILVGHRVD